MQYAGKESLFFLVNFASAVRWHNLAAILLTGSYIGFVAGNIITGNGKYYRLESNNMWKDLGKQLAYYTLGMFRGEKRPFPVTIERKFNPLQKVSYIIIMYLVLPLLIISGFGLLFPETTVNRVFGINGLILTDILHITMGFLVSVFLVIHIYTCTLGPRPTSLFRGIITGYHDSEEE
jgi:thiosulfate reductase cytochrome b subunit